MTNYSDFDLLVERSATGFRAQVLASPAGTGSHEFPPPFSAIEIENLLLRVGRRRPVVRRAESSELQAAKTFGAALFKAVFAGEVEDCFRRSIAESKRLGVGLRVRLRVGGSALTDLPWEYLYNPDGNRFLALSVQTPLVRYIDLSDPVLPITVTPPIHVLVMISSPSDYPALDVDAEWRRLNDSLAGLVASGSLAIDRLDDAMLSTLQKQLRKRPYHIFHFIGHGEFDVNAQEGVLILKSDTNRGVRVGSQYLGMLLHDQASLRVAILNACEGARTSVHDPYAGSAQTLVQQGIPAVIAMQFEIGDEVASTFAHEFYGAMSDGYPIDAAVTEARKAIFAAGHELEWGTPVLYLRAPDGRIFDVERRSPEQNEEKARADRAAALIRDAGVALAYGRYREASRHLQSAAAIDPHAPNLQDLTDKAEQQRAVADTRARLRREVREHVAAATALFAKADLDAASAHVSEALKLRINDRDALALQAKIRAAEQREALSSRAAEAGPHRSKHGGRIPVQSANDDARPRDERQRTDDVDNEKDLLD